VGKNVAVIDKILVYLQNATQQNEWDNGGVKGDRAVREEAKAQLKQAVMEAMPVRKLNKLVNEGYNKGVAEYDANLQKLFKEQSYVKLSKT